MQHWADDEIWSHNLFITVKPVLSGHSKMDKTNILMTNGSLMKVESIAECSHLTCIMQNLVLKTNYGLLFWVVA